MLRVYNNLKPAAGPHVAGIYKIKIVPREWLLTYLVSDFITGKIINALQLKAGKSFIEIELLPDTYEYTEKPKSGKQGLFYEIALGGSSNNLDATTLQSLNTYRYHQFVCLLKDKQGRQKVVGNSDAGMVLQFTNKETTDKGGTQLITIDLAMDLESPAPFYETIPKLPMPSLETFLTNATFILLNINTAGDAQTYVIDASTNPQFTENLQHITITPIEPFDTVFPINTLPSTLYYVRIKATNSFSGMPDSDASVFIFTSIAQDKLYESELYSTSITATTVSLLWTASTNATGYIIQRATNQAFTANLVTVTKGPDITPYVQEDLTPSTTYYYRLAATAPGYTNSDFSYLTVTTAAATLTIGTSYQGGKIFYILQPGDTGYNASITHGLIAAPSDQAGFGSGVMWSPTNILTNANGTAIGTGAANTAAIVAAHGNGTYAAKLCSDLVLSGYDDWYLPSRDELNQLMLHKTAVGGFSSGNAWFSSSEVNIDDIYEQDMVNSAAPAIWHKTYAVNTRAIRSF